MRLTVQTSETALDGAQYQTSSMSANPPASPQSIHSGSDATVVVSFEEGEHSIPPSGSEKASSKAASPGSWLDPAPDFWSKYNKVADFEDREFVKAAGGKLDTLLIFSGLFSAVVTAFIIESMKSLRPDGAAETNELLRIIAAGFNSTPSYTPYPNRPFVQPRQAVLCTTMLFASLSCSLAAGFGAVIGKQWLNHYEHEGVLRNPADRARERQKKSHGRVYWRMEGTIGALPTVLQVALFLFLAALVEFLRLNDLPHASIAIFLALCVPGYLVTTAIAATYPYAPFQTPASITINKTFRALCQSIPKVPDTVADVMQHPFIELVELLKLNKVLDALPVGLRQLCATLITLTLLPLCLLWRLANTVTRRVLNSLHYFSGFMIEAEDEILDLKCLIYYADRASTHESLEQSLNGMSMLPKRLKLSPDHPVLVDLGKVLYKFAFDTAGKLKGPSLQGLNDFKHFLKPLRLLYTSWKHLNDPTSDPRTAHYFSQLVDTIWTKLWDVLDEDPQDPLSVSVAASIFDTPLPYPVYGSPLDRCRDIDSVNQSLLGSLLVKQDVTPYVHLLAVTLNSNRHRLPKLPEGADTASIVPHILSTLSMPTEEPPISSIVWAELLPDHLQVHQMPAFASYLANSCKGYLFEDKWGRKLDWMDRRRQELSYQAHWFCVRAVYKLVHQTPNSATWSRTLEAVEIPSLLLKISRQSKFKSIKGLAVLSFVSLWHELHLQATGGIGENLTPRSVETIVKTLRYIGEVSNYDVEGLHTEHVPQIMENILDYLEVASGSKMLKRGMKDNIMALTVGGVCRDLVQPELLNSLNTRLSKLVYA